MAAWTFFRGQADNRVQFWDAATGRPAPGWIVPDVKGVFRVGFTPDGKAVLVCTSDGVLVWDVLEYLNPVLLHAVIERLHHIVRPKAYMLAFFHSDDKLEAVPFYSFRIQEVNTLQVGQQGKRRPAQLFNNLHDRLNRNRVQGIFLGFDVITDPIFHVINILSTEALALNSQR